jgi:hypothetical protein
LALKLGTISETLSRTLAKMKSKAIIDVRKNRIRILNREALEELASGLKAIILDLLLFSFVYDMA